MEFTCSSRKATALGEPPHSPWAWQVRAQPFTGCPSSLRRALRNPPGQAASLLVRSRSGPGSGRRRWPRMWSCFFRADDQAPREGDCARSRPGSLRLWGEAGVRVRGPRPGTTSSKASGVCMELTHASQKRPCAWAAERFLKVVPQRLLTNYKELYNFALARSESHHFKHDQIRLLHVF